MRVLIAGGGIGGLSAALCLLHHGHDVEIFEQAPELGEVGAGIQIPPNATKVFAALGIADLISENAFRPESIEARMGESGLTLFEIPLAEHAEKVWGASYLHIHRADYVVALRAALKQFPAHKLHLGCSVAAYEQTKDGVTAKLSVGKTISGDVLIGADGIHSTIRTQMLGPDQPRFTGNVAWRAVVPMDRLGTDAPNPTACAWMGRGKHAVTYRLRRGELANFVGVVERDGWTNEGWSEGGSKQEALADFDGWHPTVRRIIEQSDELFKWALFDRAPLKYWVDGRVALLGDAAHPMLPFLAQGAAMAVEDAWVLAVALSEAETDPTAALRAYQDQRKPRTSRIQAASKANAKTFHKRTLAGRLGTYGPMWIAGRVAPKLVHQRMNYLYGHDVTRQA
jgi:salicylate hydroxylase